MIHFADRNTDFANLLQATYDWPLVVLSYAIAVAASYAGLLMSERVVVADDRRERWMWLVGGAFVMGHGVWAMHFTGMLAFELPVFVSYDYTMTTLSVGPAILASGLAIHLMTSRNLSRVHLFAGGALFGDGVGIMHFTGMDAMLLDAEMRYSPTLFALSILVAMALGVAALYAQELRHVVYVRGKNNPLRWLSAGIMGLAISGMHYTAMAGVYFFPMTSPQAYHTGLTGDDLATEVSAVSLILLALAIGATMIDQRLKSTVQMARLTRQRMVEAIESLTDGFVLFDHNGQLVMCNGVFRRMYPSLAGVLVHGTSYENILRAWAAIQRDESESADTEAYVAECLRKFREGLPLGNETEEDRLHDGRWIYIRQRSVKSGGLVGVWSDVTPIKNLQETYERQANYDALTSLPNRGLFGDRLGQAAARARRMKGSFALLYIDIDGFKPVNDTYGHSVGDGVLVEIGKRIKAAVRETDTVARLGGDEFAVIVEPDGDATTASIAAERIIEALGKPFVIGDITCRIGASIGIGIAGADIDDAETVVRQADECMYAAKKAGGNAYRIAEN